MWERQILPEHTLVLHFCSENDGCLCPSGQLWQDNKSVFFCVPEEAWRRENVFLPGDICLCHSDRKSWWINQPQKTKTKQKARRVRKHMAKEKTVRILYVSGLWLPFHKQPSSYLCIIYLNILFLSSSCVWLWDFEKGWSLRKVSSIVYWEKVEASLLKLRNV